MFVRRIPHDIPQEPVGTAEEFLSDSLPGVGEFGGIRRENGQKSSGRSGGVSEEGDAWSEAVGVGRDHSVTGALHGSGLPETRNGSRSRKQSGLGIGIRSLKTDCI